MQRRLLTIGIVIVIILLSPWVLIFQSHTPFTLLFPVAHEPIVKSDNIFITHADYFKNYLPFDFWYIPLGLILMFGIKNLIGRLIASMVAIVVFFTFVIPIFCMDGCDGHIMRSFLIFIVFYILLSLVVEMVKSNKSMLKNKDFLALITMIVILLFFHYLAVKNEIKDLTSKYEYYKNRNMELPTGYLPGDSVKIK